MFSELRIAFHNFFANLIIVLVLFNVTKSTLSLKGGAPIMLTPLNSSIDTFQPLREKESKSSTTRFYPFNVMLGTILSPGI
jgi:hypothetical protein